MSLIIRIGIAAALSACVLPGCNPFAPEQSVGIVGVDDEHVYYEYAARFTGFNILPSSLWQLDRGTEKCNRLRESRRQAGLQVNGGYWATEVIADDEASGRVIGGSLSSDRTLTIYNRTLVPATSFAGIQVLSGARLLVLAGEELRLADLAAMTITRSIPLIDGPVELYHFDGTRALLTNGDYAEMRAWILNVVTEDWVELPEVPGHDQPSYFDAVLAGGLLVTSRVETVDASTFRDEILVYDVAAGVWSVLAQYPAYDANLAFPPLTDVRGLDATRVLVSHVDDEGAATVDLISLADGARTTVVTLPILFVPVGARMYDGQIFWLTPFTDQLVTYDIATGRQSVARLKFPD